ncbi:MAG TPA: hypothetical protein VEB65_08785 [Solirubrobacterales bacterium]|nr:hypothetical protein [Solirubrobacterales bacterium]
MIGTYAAVVAVCVATLALGQAAVGLCGVRGWSWLSPPVGLALLCAICWGTVRLPGDGVVSAVVVLVLVAAAIVFLWGRLRGGAEALREGWPVALAALVAASLPFLVEGHFGILGTSFNPDMSQHLLATDRLAAGHGSQLLNQGYPLGPHAVVVALDKGLGIGLVQGFGGLTVAVAVLAPLTALAAFRDLPWLPRSGAALVVGLAYLVASYFAQGAFKETIEALFVLAFALALREAGRAWGGLSLRFVPAALIAIGAVYVYSFPGLLWLGGTAVLWLGAEFALGRRPVEWRPAGLAVLGFLVGVAPEIGRMVDFQSFETFDPNGPGLGNLFGQISPFEALGIWPSGDFRLAPGDGAVPAAGYYLGAAFGVVLLAYGVWSCWRRRETAVLAALVTCAVAYAAARAGGTPYTAAKAIEIAAPIVALTILLPLAYRSFPAYREGNIGTPTFSSSEGGETGAPPASPQGGWGLGMAASAAFVLAAGVCSLLAFANAPVGPSSYSPALTGFREDVGEGPTLVLASHQLLADEQGTPYISWEMRGGRVCIAAEGDPDDPPDGVRYVVTEGSRRDPPFPGLEVARVAKPYVLWEVTRPIPGKAPCPLIAVRQARQGPAR